MIQLSTMLYARVLRHDAQIGLSTLFFDDGELRVPKIDAPEGAGVAVEIDARDVAIALSRPMDVSITNRLPGCCAALSVTARKFRPASNCWRSIRGAGTPAGRESTSAAAPSQKLL